MAISLYRTNQIDQFVTKFNKIRSFKLDPIKLKYEKDQIRRQMPIIEQQLPTRNNRQRRHSQHCEPKFILGRKRLLNEISVTEPPADDGDNFNLSESDESEIDELDSDLDIPQNFYDPATNYAFFSRRRRNTE